jgi:D-alanine--poly(phosphoribitol) ligase subunit 1
MAAYAGVLGALIAGRIYVPLNPNFPVQRNATMLRASGARMVVTDARCLDPARAVVTTLEPAPRLLAFEPLAGAEPLPGATDAFPEPSPHDADHGAYLLFTSGSTGQPKGVLVGHRSVLAYVDALRGLVDVGPGDRCSQSFDLTFDLSAHDLFVTWASGACLCVVPEAAVLSPAKFIRDQMLTHWFSVPSVIGFLSRFNLLRPGSLPSLRCSLFCGEALTESQALAWHGAAPQSSLHNLYGPTEATIAITAHRWRPGEAVGPTVPIGLPFPGQSVAIVDETLGPTPPGEIGELLLSGSQLAHGYWQRPDLTAERFVALPHGHEHTNRWYRTGDQVRWDPAVGLVYQGRVDQQLKVRGFRVEASEIEAVVREAGECALAAVVGWPKDRDLGTLGTVAFVCGSTTDAQVILDACRARLPPYMVPGRVVSLDAMPLNVNGKVDYRALEARLASEAAGDQGGAS